MKTYLSACLLLAALPAMADWQLTTPSEVSFVTFKNTHLAEHHRFNRLSGQVNAQGEASINIDLASIDSRIPVRDERMQNLLFNVSEFANARISATLPQSILSSQQPTQFELQGHLELHGESEAFKVPVLVTPSLNGQVVVSSLAPVMIHADGFALTAGIRQLRDIAKLDSIAEVVPVHFTLNFSNASKAKD